MAEESRQQIDTEAKTLAEGVTECELWLRKIEARKEDEKDWRKDAQTAIKIYESEDMDVTTFNVLYANGQTLLPALYNSQPVPDIRRRYGDADPVAKQVVDLCERALNYNFDQFDFDTEIESCIRDSYVAGRGVLRLRFVPHENGHKDTSVERVKWDKFIQGPALSWARMPWIAFEHDLTRDELVRLNKEIGSKIELSDGDTSKDGAKKDVNEAGIKRTARTYEVWDKDNREVLFICEKHKEKPLLKIKDPLKLPGFFPAFRPLLPASRVSSMTPLVPYNAFRKQAEELNDITARIKKLVKQLKVRGLADPALSGDFEALKTCDDGQFVAAGDGATAFQAGAGGLEKSVWVWPMEPTVAALQQLYLQRDQVKAVVDQISGVGDIMRGQVDPREKLGQSQIKQQQGSIRITKWQNEIGALCRDVIRAFVGVYAKHYSDENLSVMTSLPQTDEQQKMWPEVMKVFRSDLLRGYRIDVENDSTIRADMTRNQEQMNTFLAGTAQFATSMGGLVQSAPQMAQAAMPVMVEVYTSFARRFKLGKQAEDALDKLSTMAQQSAQQPEKPDPEAEKRQAEMQMMQQKAKLDAETAQQKAAIEIQKMQAQMAHDQQMFALKEREMQMKLQAMERELQLKAQGAQLDAAVQQQNAALKAETAEADFARDQRRADMDAQNAARAGEIKLDGMKQQQRFKQQAARQRPQSEVRGHG